MSKERYYIATRGNDDEAYREVMAFAADLVKAKPELKQVTLLIPAKNNTGWFDRILGPAIVKKLFTGYVFNNSPAIFKFETAKTYSKRYGVQSEIVISCGLNADELVEVDDSYSSKVIIVIPWRPEGIQEWVTRWNPIELRSGQNASSSTKEPSCVVIKALEDLTESINMATGITHHMDEDRAKTYVLALHKYEPVLDSEVVGSYLVRELGWDTSDAKDIEKSINTLNSGKSFRGGTRTGLQHYYKMWKEQCG